MSEEHREIDVTKEKDGGVLKTILKPGTEPGVHPSKGDTIFVHYNGIFKDSGKKFDDSRARDQPFCFSLGRGQVVKGWDLAVATMCRGEIARIECRPDYAYGANGSPPKIPGNQTLVFEVEILRFEGEDLSPNRDGTICKTIITEGKKFDCPTDHGKVKVHAVGRDSSGRMFFDKHLEYNLGEGTEYGLPEGVDKAVRRMNRGEKARVILKGHYAYGLQPPPEFGLSSMAEVHFTLFMKNYEKIKATWELTDEEKLARALGFKDRGTDFLNQGKYKCALNNYQAVTLLMEHAKPTVPEEKGGLQIAERFEQMFLAALLNSALANLRAGDSIEAITFCDKVLERKPGHVKALYRKAQAYQLRKEFDEAIAIFQKCCDLEADNKAAAQQIIDCRQQKANVYTHQRKKFKGMFDRLAETAVEANTGDGAAKENVNGANLVSDQHNNSSSSYELQKLTMPCNEFDVLVYDIDELELEKIGRSQGIENLTAGVFDLPAFPAVNGLIFGKNLRFMIPLVCQWARKPDKPSINVWFLVDTGSPYTFLTMKSLKAIFGAGKEIHEGDFFYLAIQDQNSNIQCRVSKAHFKEVNILGSDGLRKLELSGIDGINWHQETFRLSNQ